jgi:hypothetical protein
MRLTSSMGVEAAAHTYPPATQESTETVQNSRRCNQQSDPKSNFGQVQTQGPAGGPSNMYGSSRHHEEQERQISAARSND